MADILGISPGTRSIGIAFLQDGKLVDWDLRSFPQKWSDNKLLTILKWIQEFIDCNQIESVAIKIPDELPTSESYITLIAALNARMESKAIRTNYYMLSGLKKHFCSKTEVNKSVLSDCVVNKYPLLAPQLEKERTNLNGYYYKLFEAIAAARLLNDLVYMDN